MELLLKTIDILVADDEPHVVRALSFIFTREGFIVETASDGEEALAKCRELNPRIIFLDLIMPKMDGVQLCRHVKGDSVLMPPYIIILTCRGQEIDKDNCLRAGANDFMTKPFSPKEVLEKVRGLLSDNR